MDWSEVTASAASGVVGGGVIGGVVSYLVSKRESKDRQSALSLEREKFEYERDAPIRERQRAALERSLRLRDGAYEAFMHWRTKSSFHEMFGDLNLKEASKHSTEIIQCCADLFDLGLTEAAMALGPVLNGMAMVNLMDRESLEEREIDEVHSSFISSERVLKRTLARLP